MKDYFSPPPPKQFDYAAFVHELENLIEQGTIVGPMRRHHDSQSFRKWKHELEDLITRIRRLRYSVNCGVENRLFRALSTAPTDKANSTAYERDFDDTISELNLIVNTYKKYGDPKAKGGIDAPIAATAEVAAPISALPLLPPEKVTMRWIQDHVSTPWLWTMGVGSAAALIFAFSLGMTAAGTKAGQAVLAWLTPAAK